MILYFMTEFGTKREIARPETFNDVRNDIDKFLDEHNYRSCFHIVPAETLEGDLVIESSNHSEFFLLRGDNESFEMKYLNILAEFLEDKSSIESV